MHRPLHLLPTSPFHSEKRIISSNNGTKSTKATWIGKHFAWPWLSGHITVLSTTHTQRCANALKDQAPNVRSTVNPPKMSTKSLKTIGNYRQSGVQSGTVEVAWTHKRMRMEYTTYIYQHNSLHARQLVGGWGPHSKCFLQKSCFTIHQSIFAHLERHWPYQTGPLKTGHHSLDIKLPNTCLCNRNCLLRPLSAACIAGLPATTMTKRCRKSAEHV